MSEHRFSFNDQETDFLSEVLSHTLRGIPMRLTPNGRGYLITLKSSFDRRKPGRRPQAVFVEEAPVTRLEV